MHKHAYTFGIVVRSVEHMQQRSLIEHGVTLTACQPYFGDNFAKQKDRCQQ